MEFSNGQIINPIMANGKKTRGTVKASSLTLMEAATKENTSRIDNKDMVSIPGRTDLNTKGLGSKVSSTAKEFIKTKKARILKENGNSAKIYQ